MRAADFSSLHLCKVLTLCREAGLAKMDHVAIDSTKVKALAKRGIEKVREEWNLVCLGHNLKKLHRHHLVGAAPA